MSTPTIFPAPHANEHAEYYQTYISLADEKNFSQQFCSQPQRLRDALGGLPNDECLKLHDPYTWNLKQVVGHMIDCERVFGTRMLRIAVGDEQPQPGIDQNAYVDNLQYESTPMSDLLDEFEHLRKANCILLKRIPNEAMKRMGTASDSPVSARANLYILAGHFEYHMRIIEKRLA